MNPRPKEVWCEACRLGAKHEKAFLPAKGDDRSRVVAQRGYTVKALRNRIQEQMAAHIAERMHSAWRADKEAIAMAKRKQRALQKAAASARVHMQGFSLGLALPKSEHRVRILGGLTKVQSARCS